MIEKGKIGARQFTILTILFTIGSSILIAPSGLAMEAKQDAWIATLLGLVSGWLMVILYNKISTRFPNTTFVQYTEEILGKWLGKIICFLYFCYFFTLAALVLRNIGDFVSTQVLPYTPIQYIHIFFLLVIIMGVRNGLESFTRAAEIFFPWVFIFLFLMVILLPPKFQFEHLLPLFGYGSKPILRAALPLISTPYMELVVFLVLMPYVSSKSKTSSAFLIGMTIGGVILLIISLLSILVLGPDTTARHLYPSYSLAKKISIGNFLERLEVMMAGIWFITIYFKLALCFYASTMTFAQLFNLKEAKPLYLPFGMLLIVYSIVAYPDITYFMQFAGKIDFVYSLPYAVLFPLVILLVAIVRKKGYSPKKARE